MPTNKLQWKMPTWTGLNALLGLMATTATQIANVMPSSWRAGLGAASVILLGIERTMQAVDYRSLMTAAGFSAPTPAPVVPVPVGQAGAPVGLATPAPAKETVATPAPA
jgi:hypothetical protein